jgi:hypothetical protein
MFRARLAALTLTGGLMLVAGCTNLGSNGWFSRWRSNCDCDSMVVGPIDGGTVVGSDTLVNPPPPLPPNAFPGVNPPTGPMAPPPRVIPIPQAPSTSYTP